MSTMLRYALFLFIPSCVGLGINCRGSGVCPLATFENTQSVDIMQALRNQIFNTNLPPDTVYGDGEHITCVGNKIAINIGPQLVNLGGSIPAGAVCAFLQNMNGNGLNLQQIQVLADALLDHHCTTCGSVPITFLQQENGDVKNGELTFNFVSEANADCSGNCIASGQNDGSGSSNDNQGQPSETVVTVVQTVVATATVTDGSEPGTTSSPLPSTTQESQATVTVVVNNGPCSQGPILSLLAVLLLWTLVASAI